MGTQKLTSSTNPGTKQEKPTSFRKLSMITKTLRKDVAGQILSYNPKILKMTTMSAKAVIIVPSFDANKI